MQIDVNGVKITLTKDQLLEIDRQIKKSKSSAIDRIQTLQDVYEELGIDNSTFVLYEHPKTKEEKATNAHALLLRIVKAYNEGKEPNWKNTNEYKYLPYINFRGGTVSVFVDFFCACFVSGGLFFTSRQNAEDALKKFRNVYNDYWMVAQ